MKFLPLLPEAQNDYKGHKVIVILVLLLTLISTARSLIHIFFPDGGSNSIAGLAIPGDANSAIIFTFAWTGLYQLIFAAIMWIVLIRYKKFIPLLILLMLFEELGLLLIPIWKPIASSLITRMPPEAIGNKVLLPLILILFFASLFPATKHKSKES